MTQEEKAKAYDEALERAKVFKEHLLEINDKDYADEMDYIFPELKESEDEKVEKAIFGMVYDSDNDLWSSYDVSKSDVLAWLEKQDEYVEINPSEFDTRLQTLIGKFDTLPKEELIGSLSFWLNVVQNDGAYKDKEKQGEPYGQRKECLGCQFNYAGECKGSCAMKRDEQKPAEWSEEDKKMIGRIRSIVEKYAFSQSAVDVNGDLCEKEYIDTDNWLKSLKDRIQPKQEWKQENIEELTEFENAMMHIGGSFFGQYAGLDPNDTASIKEQAELLLELAPKTEWSKEDEKMVKDIIAAIDTLYYHGMVNWLKSLKDRVRPKQEWGKEDETKIRAALAFIKSEFPKEGNEEIMEDTIEWLKSLRPQPKQEWSEEDEKNLQGIIDEIQANKSSAPSYDINVYDRYLSWLKSLRPQKQWRPSDEQMVALSEASGIVGMYSLRGMNLQSLYNDLKKL